MDSLSKVINNYLTKTHGEIFNNDEFIEDKIYLISSHIKDEIAKRTKKKRKKTIPAAIKMAVWNKYIGEDKGTGRCFVGCGSSISIGNHDCGHIVAEALGGKIDIDNLRPI